MGFFYKINYSMIVNAFKQVSVTEDTVKQPRVNKFPNDALAIPLRPTSIFT